MGAQTLAAGEDQSGGLNARSRPASPRAGWVYPRQPRAPRQLLEVRRRGGSINKSVGISALAGAFNGERQCTFQIIDPGSRRKRASLSATLTARPKARSARAQPRSIRCGGTHCGILAESPARQVSRLQRRRPVGSGQMHGHRLRSLALQNGNEPVRQAAGAKPARRFKNTPEIEGVPAGKRPSKSGRA